MNTANADDLAAKCRAALLNLVERKPVSDCPKEGTYSLVDDGDEHGFGRRRVQAIFMGGKWVRPNSTPLPFEPTHWLALKS
jgi:hypothetical protein